MKGGVKFMWKVYFWFSLFNLMVNLGSGYLSDVAIIDVRAKEDTHLKK
ncbi:MAG: hypothetical protein ACI9FO_001232 [Methylophagaceae bacterium]|jgi:hypothetical protein